MTDRERTEAISLIVDGIDYSTPHERAMHAEANATYASWFARFFTQLKSLLRGTRK